MPATTAPLARRSTVSSPCFRGGEGDALERSLRVCLVVWARTSHHELRAFPLASATWEKARSRVGRGLDGLCNVIRGTEGRFAGPGRQKSCEEADNSPWQPPCHVAADLGGTASLLARASTSGRVLDPPRFVGPLTTLPTAVSPPSMSLHKPAPRTLERRGSLAFSRRAPRCSSATTLAARPRARTLRRENSDGNLRHERVACLGTTRRPSSWPPPST